MAEAMRRRTFIADVRKLEDPLKLLTPAIEPLATGASPPAGKTYTKIVRTDTLASKARRASAPQPPRIDLIGQGFATYRDQSMMIR